MISIPRIFCAWILCFVCALQLSAAERQDLPDFTPSFSLRSAFNGVALSVSDKINWTLHEITDTQYLDKFAKNDPFASFSLGYVQFLSADTQECMAISPSGVFVLKSCQEDLDRNELESVFSLIPTTTSAVQIRSMVLKADECISVVDVAQGSIFGLQPCSVKSLSLIDLRNLMLILPSLEASTLINP